MTAGGFFLLGTDGMPEAFIDRVEFEATKRRISYLLAAHSRDKSAVLAIIARELQSQDVPEQVRTLLTLGVLYQLTTGVLGPHLTLAEATYPQNDFVGDLLALTTRESLQGDISNPEGTPSESGD
ncbi:hypothetical protein E3T28_12815 [Cryobacterium sinapicolor]|uniref:Tetracyclin repressor-like C-terminal domain-containing protein n=1 Tax=Cryobacterium sinapicolor TaxID=1259236 RepID=A0ABY2IWD0_9MICO|nr:hypothetical protein [Cryobacterium sinapicolor]TFC96220.1 hypothetical protein E3T28_12815 [Cryobacterium sinapicolor]